jgi:hypothetical protein
VDLDIYDQVTGSWQGQHLQIGEEGSCLAGDGSCTEFNLELPAVACVRGTVTRVGAPEEGVRVCLNGTVLCTTTDFQGAYCLPAPEQSWAFVELIDPVLGEYLYNSTQTGARGLCGAGPCATLDLQFHEATCISGIVREGTAPLAGATVYNQFRSVTVDGEGRYCLPALANTQQMIETIHPVDGSYIVRFPTTGSGGRCDQGGCTTQNVTFDIKARIKAVPQR